MRDREQRLGWIERLIGASYHGPERNNALVVPTSTGNLAVAFSSIVEVVPASRVQPLALLPDTYCGVLTQGNTIAPIIDASEDGLAGCGAPGHVVLVEGSGCVFGLRFGGAPFVVDLNEVEHVDLEIVRGKALPAGPLPLLDVDAVAAALLALD